MSCLSSAVGRANTQTQPAVFVVKAHFAGPSFLMPCREEIGLITHNKGTVSGAHQLLCRFWAVVDPSEIVGSTARKRLRGRKGKERYRQ